MSSKNEITLRIPVEITFTLDPEELGEERAREPVATVKDLVKYLEDAWTCEVDTEEYGQPTGAAFACSGVAWDRVTEIEDGMMKPI